MRSGARGFITLLRPIWRRASMNSRCAHASRRMLSFLQRAQLQFDLEHGRGDHEYCGRAKPSSTASCARRRRWRNWRILACGILYEAFKHFGGLGTLCETLAGRCESELSHHPLPRPRGHYEGLVNDLRLRDRRELLKDILENAVSHYASGCRDCIRHSKAGMRGGGQLMQEDLRQQDLCGSRAAGCAGPFKSPRPAHLRGGSTC